MAKAIRGMPLGLIRDLFTRGTTAGSTDSGLLERFASDRDPAAFEALIARHGPMVAATCRAILKHDHEAEDAFQATFLVLARKAGSIRDGNALAGWLHRVARRAAIEADRQARRRRQAEAEAMANRIRDEAPGDREAIARLHEEIDRLPDRHRLPVLLCDLQGLSYEEAALRLGLTEPSLRNRLARARERLKRRLNPQGSLAISAVLEAAKPSKAAVPASWSKGALALASGASASAGTALIAHSLLKGMLMARIKVVAGTLLGISLGASAAVVASGLFRDPPPEPIADPPPIARNPLEKPAQKKANSETIDVRGIVVDPDGKPVAGAKIWSGLSFSRDEPTKAIAGADGRFTIAVPKKYATGREAQYLGMFSWLTASSPGSGFGIGWNDPATRGDLKAEQVVRLVPDGVPIEGRVLDLEGRPVAGAGVVVSRCWYDPQSPDDLAPWLAKIRSGAVRGIWQDLRSFPVDIGTTTDDEGRFRITGVGHDRVADLAVSGPTIARTTAFVLNRDEPEIRTIDKAGMGKDPLVLHAPRFELAAAPTRVIEGVVRDSDTDEPIVGLKVRGMVFEENSLLFPEGIHATTDADGRYRLTGLERGPSYRLEFIPPDGTPYLRTSRQATPSAASGPVEFDATLKKGAIVRGRVVEKGSGRPAVGNVDVVAFEDTPRDGYSGALSGYTPTVEIDAEGRFSLAALPGRGLLLVRGDDIRYRGARGFEAIAGFHDGYFRTRPHYTSPGGYHAIAEIQPDIAADPGSITIEVDPGLTVKVNTVDPEGEPIGGTTVKGLGELFDTSPYPVASPQFSVHALDPSKPRRVVITHEGRKLIGSACLKGDETGPVTIQLQPWGILTGRVVDDDGSPVANVRLTSPTGNQNRSPEDSDIIPGTDWNSGLVLPDDGRFRIEGLVPGLKYGASASNTMYAGGVLFRDVVVEPGKVTDVGDRKLTPYKKEEQ